MSDTRQYQRLEYNKTYEMYVVQVIENRRSFTKDNKVYYIHDVLFKNDQEIYFKPEYPSIYPTQNDFVVGKKMKFICTLTGRCDEISPVVGGQEPPKNANIGNPMSVGGTAYSQALALATQMKCAECTSLGKEIDLQEVFALASDLETWLTDRKSIYG